MVSINLCLSLKERGIYLWGEWHQKLRQQQQQQTPVLMLPVSGHTPKSWGEERRKEKASPRGPSQCLFLWQFNNRQASYKVNFFPPIQPMLHAFMQSIVTESPAWVWWATSLCAPKQGLCQATSTCTIHCAKGTATKVTHPSQFCSCTPCPEVVSPGLSCSQGTASKPGHHPVCPTMELSQPVEKDQFTPAAIFTWYSKALWQSCYPQ